MHPDRKTSLIFGLFFAGTFVFSIPALFFYDPVLHDAGYILAGDSTRASPRAHSSRSCLPSATSRLRSSSFLSSSGSRKPLRSATSRRASWSR